MSDRSTSSASRKGAAPYAGARPGGGDDRTRLYVIIGVVVAVVVLAGIAVLLTQGGNDSASAKEGTGAYAAARAEREQAPVTVDGAALPPAVDSPTNLVPVDQDPAVGQTPPKLEGYSFDGSKVTIDPADGKAKMVIFLAHWCPHCQNEVPKVQKWLDEGKLPKNVEMYAVSTGVSPDRANYPPSKWIMREKFTPPVLLDSAESAAAQAYGMQGTPYFVAINSDGTVAQRGSGEVPINEFDKLIKSLK